MTPMKTAIDFWFTIEPYVFIERTNGRVLLYNTLDGVTLESDEDEVIELMQETLMGKNCSAIF